MANGNNQVTIKADPTELQAVMQAATTPQTIHDVVSQMGAQGMFGAPVAPAQDTTAPQVGDGQVGPTFDPDKGAIVANVTGMAPLTGTPLYGSQTQSALPAVPLPAATGTAVPPAQPWAPQAAGPTTEQTLAGAAQALPTSESALGAIPTAPQPTQAGAVQPTRGQRFLHGLGQVLGTALGAVSPGVAMQIPGTPLGRIVAQNRALAEQRAQAATTEAQARALEAQTQAAAMPAKTEADVREALSRAALDEATAKRMGNTIPITLANGQQVWLNEKDASTVLGRQVTAQAGITKEAMSVDARKYAADVAAGKRPKAVAGTVNGVPAFGQEVPGKPGFYEPGTDTPLPNFQPPPNYMQGVTPVQILSPEGVPTVGEMPRAGGPIRPATVAGAPGTPAQPAVSTTGALGHEIGQATIVSRAGQQLIDDVQANKKLMGNTQAIVRSALLDTPWADPATAGLRAEIQTFAALQPSMHGLRGQAAMDEFGRILGGIPNNPDALIASIQGILKTATAVNPQLSSTRAGGPAPAVGSIETGKGGVQYRFKGGDRNKKENWEKVVGQ